MVPRLRHRQTKGAATVERRLPPPRQSSTLPVDAGVGREGEPNGSKYSWLEAERICGAEMPRISSFLP